MVECARHLVDRPVDDLKHFGGTRLDANSLAVDADEPRHKYAQTLDQRLDLGSRKRGDDLLV